MKADMGLDKPFIVQYLRFLFGYSIPSSAIKAFFSETWADPISRIEMYSSSF